MSPSFMFQVGLVVAASVAGTYLLADNIEPESVVVEGPAAVETAPTKISSVVSIPRSQGQFFTRGHVNSGSVEFLVDTGASIVALTATDARKAGVRLDGLVFDRPVYTANGQTMGAAVTLRNVRLGGISVSNVDAIVLKEGLKVSLLGMSFLNELQKVEVTQNQMILRR